MLKFFLGIAIVGLTSFIGYLLAKKYRQKKAFFMQLYEFNERFLSELSYRRRPIRELVASYAYQGEFKELLDDFFLSLDKKSSKDLAVFDLPEYTFLTKEEKGLVADYFLMFGRGDSLSQKGYFSSLKDTLSSQAEKAADTCKRYGDLYMKIGFLCGLLILILII